MPKKNLREVLEKELAEICVHCSYRERLASDAEREAIKLKQVRAMSERLGEELTAVAVALQEIERHALRGFRSHARKAAQGIDQACECRRVFQNGSFMPGGRLSPDMRPEYLS